MSFLRSTLLPVVIVLLFGLALFAVSARIWLPGDMARPGAAGLIARGSGFPWPHFDGPMPDDPHAGRRPALPRNHP